MYQRAILIPPQLILIYNPMEGELLPGEEVNLLEDGLARRKFAVERKKN